MLHSLKTTRLFGIVMLTVLVLGTIVSSAGAGIVRESETREPQKFAILIAIDRYHDEHLPTLKYCKSDALALKDTLIAGGFQEKNIILMTDDAEEFHLVPTKSNIRRVIINLENLVSEGDMVCFFFSGCGGNRDGLSILLPIDSIVYRSQWVGSLKIQEVLDTLGRCKAESRLIVLDACLGGSNVNPLILPEKTAVLLAEKGGGLSYESPVLQGSVFTHYMIRGLQGEADEIGDENGKVDLTELFHYVKSHMIKHKEFQTRPLVPGLLVSNDMEDIFGLEIVDLESPTPKTGSVTIESISDSESQTDVEFVYEVSK